MTRMGLWVSQRFNVSHFSSLHPLIRPSVLQIHKWGRARGEKSSRVDRGSMGRGIRHGGKTTTRWDGTGEAEMDRAE